MNITHEGARYLAVTRAQAEAAGIPEGVIAAAEAAEKAEAARTAMRARIAEGVGDTPSILGTVADVMGLLVAGQMARTVALADHASNEAQRQELAMLQALAGDADLVQLCRDGLAAIQAGDVVLTAAVKGVENVFAEALARSTATAALLAPAAQSEA